MALSVMKVIGIDFNVVLIFYSFNDVFLLVLEFIKCLWGLIGLLSNYHNSPHSSNLVSSRLSLVWHL